MSRKARIIYNGRKLTNLWRHGQRDQVWQKSHRGIGPKANALQQDSARNEKAAPGRIRYGLKSIGNEAYSSAAPNVRQDVGTFKPD